MTESDFQHIVQNEHECVWNKLLGETYQMSKLAVHILPEITIRTQEGHVSKYVFASDTICIVFVKELLDDSYFTSGQSADWKAELRHELIHEYQHKTSSKVSLQGNELMKIPHLPFPGNDHGPDFYSAICECAPKLGLTPEKLLKSI